MIDDISPPGSWAKELAARPHTISDVWQALRDAEARLARAEAALRWSLAEGAHFSRRNGRLYDRGCGCCSGELRVPDEFREAIDAARGAP